MKNGKRTRRSESVRPSHGEFAVRCLGQPVVTDVSESEAWQKFLSECTSCAFVELLRGPSVLAWLKGEGNASLASS